MLAKARSRKRTNRAMRGLPRRPSGRIENQACCEHSISSAIAGREVPPRTDLRLQYGLGSRPVEPQKPIACGRHAAGSHSTCAPLICPALLHDILSLLARPWLLKLSTDRTYRLMHDKYVLLTMGINVKKFHEIELVDGAFASSFVPMAFAIACVQSGDAYKQLA